MENIIADLANVQIEEIAIEVFGVDPETAIACSVELENQSLDDDCLPM